MTQPSILLINKNKIIEKNKIVEQLKKEIIKQNLIKQEQLTIKQESDINLNIPDDFDISEYLDLNSDIQKLKLTDHFIKLHYVQFGKQQQRIYKYDDIPIGFTIENYYNWINTKEQFSVFPGFIDKDINQDMKVEFRNFCRENIKYLRNIILPEITKGNNYETVLIEFRKFPHLEFIIRNAINKLGPKWSHTIICGTDNYNFMVLMCNKISPNIKIIRTPFQNMTRDEYSIWLTTLKFWNLIVGEKVLIHQEDSIIFKNNIDDFIHYDYIGAPWPIDHNPNNTGVGNGGFSLRSKSIMIQVINSISLKQCTINNSTHPNTFDIKKFCPDLTSFNHTLILIVVLPSLLSPRYSVALLSSFSSIPRTSLYCSIVGLIAITLASNKPTFFGNSLPPSFLSLFDPPIPDIALIV